MKFIDDFGFYNIDPIQPDGLPTGNDGWVMSAFAKKLELELDYELLDDTYIMLRRAGTKLPKLLLPIERWPGKQTPYLSRDFILGVTYVFKDKGKLVATLRDELNWNFSPFEIPEFDFFKCLKQAISCIGKHRNYFWQNKLDQMYRFAFKVPVSDRKFLLEQSGYKIPLLYRIIDFLDRNIYFKPSTSSKFLMWLKYDTKLEKEDWLNRFKKDHPFTKKVFGISDS